MLLYTGGSLPPYFEEWGLSLCQWRNRWMNERFIRFKTMMWTTKCRSLINRPIISNGHVNDINLKRDCVEQGSTGAQRALDKCSWSLVCRAQNSLLRFLIVNVNKKQEPPWSIGKLWRREEESRPMRRPSTPQSCRVCVSTGISAATTRSSCAWQHSRSLAANLSALCAEDYFVCVRIHAVTDYKPWQSDTPPCLGYIR